MLDLLTIAACTAYGAAAYRWRGHGNATTPQSIRRLSVCLLPVAAVAQYGWAAMLGVGIASYLGLLTGHGRYYTLGRGPYPERPDNWPGRIVTLVLPNWERRRHDWLALSITGMAFTAPAAAYLAYSGAYFAAIIAVLAGIGKPVPYELGWRLHGYANRDPNAYNEMYYGALLGLCFGVIIA